jgi:hypothetical protein
MMMPYIPAADLIVGHAAFAPFDKLRAGLAKQLSSKINTVPVPPNSALTS